MRILPRQWVEARRAIWRLRRAIVDLRLAYAELKVMKLQNKLAEIDSEGCILTIDEAQP